MWMTMIGVVDVGGGMRGIYGAGIFDRCLDESIDFDYAIGVSSGSANIASYVSGQRGRNYTFYTEYAERKEYMSFHNFLKTGNYLNLDYIYGTLSKRGGENPLDYSHMLASGKTMKIVTTDADTGKPVYYDLRDMAHDDYGALKCSSCVPMAAKAYRWKGKEFYDGALSDPIPVQKAFDAGCDRVVLILTRPKDFFRSPKDRIPARALRFKYPVISKAIKDRTELYNRQLARCLELEKEGSLLIVAPSDIETMKTFSRDEGQLNELYEMGYKDAAAIKPFLEGASAKDTEPALG